MCFYLRSWWSGLMSDTGEWDWLHFCFLIFDCYLCPSPSLSEQTLKREVNKPRSERRVSRNGERLNCGPESTQPACFVPWTSAPYTDMPPHKANTINEIIYELSLKMKLFYPWIACVLDGFGFCHNGLETLWSFYPHQYYSHEPTSLTHVYNILRYRHLY